MPIYEYRCDSCGHTLDALQKISDTPLTDCPECESQALKRLISAPAFRLKGGGWYETDFKSDKEKKRNLAEGAKEPSDAKSDKGDKGDKPGKGDKADKKAETKPDQAPKSASGKSKSKGTGSEAA
jgi:putative FmdB family regulatory protein